MTHILDTYTYEGQPSSDWPRWLVARNFAHSRSGDKLVIHLFLHTLVVVPGQTIGLTSTQEIVILR